MSNVKNPEACEFCMEVQRQSELTKDKDYSLTYKGKVIVGIFGASVFAISAVAIPFLAPGVRKICLPFLPASEIQVQNVFTALNKPNKKQLIDLGSGDGRIVIEAAKQGYKAVGVELNPWLVLYSRYKAWREGVHKNTRFIRKDMFKVDFSEYNHVVVFGVEYLMPSLEEKVKKECPKDCEVIACRFAFPTLLKISTIGTGVDTVWKYTLDETVAETIHEQMRDNETETGDKIRNNVNNGIMSNT